MKDHHMRDNLAIPFGSPDATIASASERIRRRERTSVELVEQCLRRIDELEPRVRAWVIVDRVGALEQARRLDAELAAGR